MFWFSDNTWRRIFLWRRRKTEKDKEENICKRKINFFCGGEEKRRRKTLGEGKYLFVEDREGKGKKYLEREFVCGCLLPCARNIFPFFERWLSLYGKIKRSTSIGKLLALPQRGLPSNKKQFPLGKCFEIQEWCILDLFNYWFCCSTVDKFNNPA